MNTPSSLTHDDENCTQRLNRLQNILAYIADCQPDGKRYLDEAHALSTDYNEEQRLEREELRRQLDAAHAQVEQLEAAKDYAYLQRNHLVAALARCFPSGIRKTAIEGWSEDWHGCVYLDLPAGQISYHYHDSHAFLFAGLPAYDRPYDGHDKAEVHRRLESVRIQSAPPSHHTPGGKNPGAVT